MLGFHCCVGFSLVVMSRGHSVVAVTGSLAVAALAAQHRLQGTRVRQLWHAGSAVADAGLAVVARGFGSCGSWVQ